MGAAAESAIRSYRFFGWTLGTVENLDHLLHPASQTPQLQYVVRREPAPDDQGELVYESPIPGADGSPRLLIRRTAEKIQAVFPSAGVFHISSHQIVCYPRSKIPPQAVENLLLGTVAAFWLELRGIPTLHASAVEIDGTAVAFASHSGGGKSSLAAMFLKQGRALLSDDVLAVQLSKDLVLARPAFPLMRMWPEEALFFLGRVRGLEKAHPVSRKRRVRLPCGSFGDFCRRPLPLARFYFPAWRSDDDPVREVEMAPLSPRDGVIELLKYSFAGKAATAMGLQSNRLDLLSQVARRVPMRRLVYPKGLNRLVRVREAIVADLKSAGTDILGQRRP